MLNIYQEYVRNHHFSLQILTECKQNPQFSGVLSRLEEHSACKGRSLETFLTYPMHQIPRYIITLHEILAHTPHEHVERRSLENARVQLEHLSRQMHDEVWPDEMIMNFLHPLLFSKRMWIRWNQLVFPNMKWCWINPFDDDCHDFRLARRKTSANVWLSNGWSSKDVTSWWTWLKSLSAKVLFISRANLVILKEPIDQSYIFPFLAPFHFDRESIAHCQGESPLSKGSSEFV